METDHTKEIKELRREVFVVIAAVVITFGYLSFAKVRCDRAISQAGTFADTVATLASRVCR